MDELSSIFLIDSFKFDLQFEISRVFFKRPYVVPTTVTFFSTISKTLNKINLK